MLREAGTVLSSSPFLMEKKRRHILTFFLLAVFLALNSLTYPQILVHAFHHSHHSAASHGQPLCFWVCSAGQMEETSNPFFISNLGLIGKVEITIRPDLPFQLQPVRLARGPPSLPLT